MVVKRLKHWLLEILCSLSLIDQAWCLPSGQDKEKGSSFPILPDKTKAIPGPTTVSYLGFHWPALCHCVMWPFMSVRESVKDKKAGWLAWSWTRCSSCNECFISKEEAEKRWGQETQTVSKTARRKSLTVDPDTFASLRNTWHLAFYRIPLETLTLRIIRRLCNWT